MTVSLVVGRRTKLLIGLGCIALVAYAVAPLVIAQRVRARLAELGFADSHVEVESIGLDHLRLRNVRLDDNIELGTVDLDRGVQLLWSDPKRVTIPDARADTSALARVRRHVSTRSRRAPKTPSSLDISISVRDPSRDGWTATARGRLVVGSDVTLEDGHVDVRVSRADHGTVAVRGASLSAEVHGNLSQLAISGRGQLQSERIEVGRFAVTNASVPFVVEDGSISFASGRGSLLGGEVATDAFRLGRARSSLVIRARGLRLDQMLQPATHVAGTGLIDGALQLQVGADGMRLERGELRARAPGTLQLRHPATRAAIAKAQGPFAVHAAIGAALADFRYETLVAKLAAPGAPAELTLQTRGRGRRNQQELDIAINMRGVRDTAPRLLKGLP